MERMKSALFLLVLMVSIQQSGISQVVLDDYKKMNMEEKRLIIAPFLKIDSVDGSFMKAYPKMVCAEDSLFRYLNNMLAEKIRKYSSLYRVYNSTYKEEPKFVKRKLFLSDSDSIEMQIPNDSTQIKMILKDKNQTEPDFILFLHIGSIGFGYRPNTTIDYLEAWASPGGIGSMTTERGLIFENVKYVYWDNKLGRVAAFNRRHLYFTDLNEDLINPDNPFSFNSKIVDLFVRYILSRTPFSNGSLMY